MATVTHYIRSRLSYRDDNDNDDDPLNLDQDQDQSISPSIRITHPPKFVPSVGLFTAFSDSTTRTSTSNQSDSVDVANWYRSLARQGNANPVHQHQQPQPLPADTPRQILDSITPDATPPSSPRPSLPAAPKRQQQRVQGCDWFISRPISHSASAPSSSSGESLADILSRNPPTTDHPLRPPVFLHLGPSNKGWAMLQNQGWSEGEVLGSTRNGSEAGPSKRQQTDDAYLRSTGTSFPTLRINEKMVAMEEKREKDGPVNCIGRRLDSTGPPTSPSPSEARTTEATHDDETDTVKAKVLLRNASVPLIDLTLSDDTDDDDEENPGGPEPNPDDSCSGTNTSVHTMTTDSPHAAQTALLTPLPTVLKSDRLGIGLNAKTEGPYRASVKRVTHNAAALAAHVKAGEDMRHAQRRFGKGRRAFVRTERLERESRQNMMAYLSEP
jgi:hypothetical protein